jgi:hypothetical protein
MLQRSTTEGRTPSTYYVRGRWAPEYTQNAYSWQEQGHSPLLVTIYCLSWSILCAQVTVHKPELESNGSSCCLSFTLSAATSDNCSYVNDFTEILYQELASADNTTIIIVLWTLWKQVVYKVYHKTHIIKHAYLHWNLTSYKNNSTPSKYAWTVSLKLQTQNLVQKNYKNKFEYQCFWPYKNLSCVLFYDLNI